MFLEIKFNGGLGNQMFQYAAGRALCIKKKIPYLLLNTESYTNESLGRKFGLINFHIKGKLVENDTVKKMFRKRTKLNTLISGSGLHKNIEEKDFVLQPIEKGTGLLTSLEGFWQSPQYFNDIRQLLLKEFTPLRVPSSPLWLHEKNTVAVHVRRTDYLDEHRYGFIGAQYYRDAMALIKKKMAEPLFIFFSDDILWCKQNFADGKTVFFEDAEWVEDYLQLYLMSKCAHQVIANSSFSWWAAWLNQNPGKIVTRPLTPFKEKTLLYESHYPEEWIAINNN